MRHVSGIVALLLASTTAFADVPTRQWQSEQAAASLKASVLYLAAHSETQNDQISGILIALGLLKSARADRALVSLADYYLGESVSEDMNSVITHRGKILVPLLRSRISMPPDCEPGLKCLTREQRNARLNGWIGQLERGQVIEFNQ
jgi:hypothetical protein